MDKVYDFSGWATRNNVRCSDGRTIRKDAFKHNDGEKVPLVWNHNHKDADNVLGYALLENRNEGVYAYGSFNDTEQGRNAKELVIHGDITSLSIYANQLKQNGGDVIHGSIREVSLVLAGANAGAKIETVIAHSDDVDEEAYIYNASEEITIYHAEANASEEPVKEEPKMDEQKTNDPKHSEEEKTLKEVVNTMTEEQKTAMYALIGLALAQKNNEESTEEDTNMKHNAFNNEEVNENNTLTHDEFSAIVADARRCGSMKDAFIQHGITDVDALFPEAQAVNKTPAMIARDMDWVAKVMAGVHHVPFSRIKSTAADITEEDARAKGYIKGNQKVEEFITAMKRTTNPTTIYKLQKMDRDDVIDITDFDVIAWLKSEMRMMLNEEIARAILFGDGRSSASNDKIDELNVRPIISDNNVFNVKWNVAMDDTDTEYTFAKKFIREVIKCRKAYKGSGNPSLFISEDSLTSMLLIEDTNGRVIYDTIEKLTTALRVKEIITVPVLDDNAYENVLGVLVNLNDYTVGADKGGAVSMFEDFDIDFNKEKYLIETRCSGALTKPYSAVTFLLNQE